MASGGPRPGSGRKPKLLTALLLEHPQAEDDIRFAYDLFRDTMRDETYPIDLRLECADKVLNRLCGKPTQAMQIQANGSGALKVHYMNDWRAHGRGDPGTG